MSRNPNRVGIYGTTTLLRRVLIHRVVDRGQHALEISHGRVFGRAERSATYTPQSHDERERVQ